jgi:hypothetical protein
MTQAYVLTALAAPEHVPGPERNMQVEDVDKQEKDYLRSWVLAAKWYAGTIEKARSRDHIVEKVKEEIENYLKIMFVVLDSSSRKGPHVCN